MISYKLAIILLVMIPGEQTFGNIVVYGFVTKVKIYSIVCPANLTQLWSLTVPSAFSTTYFRGGGGMPVHCIGIIMFR